MTEARTDRPNPYVGPRAFRRGEPLHGRATELDNLVDLCIAERIVLLHSPSGAGKTSLIHAGLLPALEREAFRPLPVIRVNLEPPPRDGINRYAFSTISSLEEGLGAGAPLSIERMAEMSILDYLTLRATKTEERVNDLLVFDQFEEVLTVDPVDLDEKAAYFAQLAEVLRDRSRWALFSMRDDFVAALDPYTSLLPTRLTTTFRLDFLGRDAALEAVQAPAHQLDVTFSEGAAAQLVDDLRRTRVQRPDGSTVELGPHVEPVQLQVVCRQLWERRLPPAGEEISVSDLGDVGEVDGALAQYYEDTVASVAVATTIGERVIRDWFESALITEQGFRSQVDKGPCPSDPERSGKVLKELQDGHLIRAEQRRGTYWYELTHDRMIEPVESSNRRWRDAHLTTLQRQAELWDTNDRHPGLLLLGDALRRAEDEAGEAEQLEDLTPTEVDFRSECRRAEAQHQRDARIGRLIKVLAVGATALSVVVVGLLLRGHRNSVLASHERAAASERQLAAQVRSRLGRERLDRTLLVDVEALDGQDRLASRSLLLADLQRAPQVTRVLDAQGALSNVVVRPDGREVIAGRADGEIELWDMASGRRTTLRGHDELVGGLAVSGDGRTLASASDDRTVMLWDLAGPSRRRLGVLRHAAVVTSVAFSPPGGLLASGDLAGSVSFWDPGGLRLLAGVESGHGPVLTVSFSPDGRTVASGHADGSILLWDATTRQVTATLPGHRDMVRSVAFSPDGAALASGGNDGKVIVWDVATRQPRFTLTGHTRFVRSVAFSPDGTRLASGSEDGTVQLWDPAGGAASGPPLAVHHDLVTGVAFGPDGHSLASSGLDRSVVLWDLRHDLALSERLSTGPTATTSVATSHDGRTLAWGAADGTVTRWDASRPGPTPVGRTGSVTSVAVGPDGAAVAAGSTDGSVAVWTAGASPTPASLAGHRGPVTGVAFSPDGATVASSGADGTVLVSDAAGARPVVTLTGHRGAATGVAYTADGRSVAAGGDDETVLVWDIASGRVRTIRPGNGRVRSIAIAPDGRVLAAGGQDGTIVLWDLAADRAFGPFPLAGHGAPVTSVSFTAPGELASSSEDSAIFLWDIVGYAASHQPLGVLGFRHGPGTSLASDGAGGRLISAGADGAIVVTDVGTGSWRSRACSIANRNLDRDEWNELVGPGRPYHLICAPP